MPEDSKKNQHKAKHDPKEQRKPRQRNHLTPVATEKNVEKKSEPKVKVPVPTKPVYEEPGPEFYKGLKRETDEILKITEEANSKYKKKEIQSNWAKYEIPIESYEEIEEHENMGADYEKLIQAPLSIGGHFQFKHEKSWDLNTGPSLYDSYFDINMDNLATALSTLPFYERNSIEKSLFSQTDITNMDNRSTRYKQKYYNDKSFTTPELEAQDKLIATLKEDFKAGNEIENNITQSIEMNIPLDQQDIGLENPSNLNKPRADNVEVQKNLNMSKEQNKTNIEQETAMNISKKPVLEPSLGIKDICDDDLDDILLDAPGPVDNVNSSLDTKVDLTPKIKEGCPQPVPAAIKQTKESSTSKSVNPPVMESPEDLEKWLDDFLET